MTGSHTTHDLATAEFFHHSSGQRTNTDAVLVEALRTQYPELHLTVAPAYSCNLLAFAASGHASATPIQESSESTNAQLTSKLTPSLKWRTYIPPARRLDGAQGVLVDQVLFGKYLYKWNEEDFLVYVVNGRDGTSSYPTVVNSYILSSNVHKSDDLILTASRWTVELHDEVWVFDQGYWQKSRQLYESAIKASWDNVILDEDMKDALRADVSNFFNNRSTYEKLKVPWKRGLIYYGPPGNGKTISLKAIMHDLYSRAEPVPTLYVRSLSSFGGPELALADIFSKARSEAPCLLVFEDLDSLISDNVRSYFLNEVDGLNVNDGILMVGSTNHLDRLDPGISKRPSRFDRKYLFPDPNLAQRIQYCHFWQGKLADNPDIEFPDELCEAIAKITDKFSFAYIQEAFVATLLAIAVDNQSSPSLQRRSRYDSNGFYVGENSDDDLDQYILWKVMKKQVKILRDELDSESANMETNMAALDLNSQ